MTIKTWLAGALAATFAVTLTATAAAEERRNAGDYEYRFTDDPLGADTMGGYTPRLVVINRKQKDRLMRPRLNFVPEMLKSVEAL